MIILKKINDVDINYVIYGNEEGEDLVLLHGWGQNIDMMRPIGDNFLDKRVIIIDLPGHGSSSEPTYAWELSDFVEAIHELLESINCTNPILVGHSFGGKISLLYASKYPVKKLVLLASPFKKEIQKQSLKVKVLKQLKKVPGLNKFEEFAKKHIGSDDYRNASGVMRQILVNHVNTDICEDIKKIKAPAIIIWGTNDEAVPVERAQELENLLPDAGVIIYDGCTHYAYLERLAQTNSVIRSFIG